MPKVSVITPTIRPEGLDVVHKSLQSQTFKDFEWLICAKEACPITTDKFVTKWIADDFKGGFWTLNRAYNKLFKNCSGKMIVTWQDWIWTRPDALQRLVDRVNDTDGGIISGVGDQYERLNKWGKPEIKIWSDPRKNDNHGDFYECFPNDIEWNFAAFPTEKIFAVGGMDEQLDWLGYGGDQLQVGERWDALGFKTYLDQTNESFTVRHDRSHFGGQELWDKNHVLFNGKYQARKEELIASKEWPILNFLS